MLYVVNMLIKELITITLNWKIFDAFLVKMNEQSSARGLPSPKFGKTRRQRANVENTSIVFTASRAHV